jgi:hypothetical protein
VALPNAIPRKKPDSVAVVARVVVPNRAVNWREDSALKEKRGGEAP